MLHTSGALAQDEEPPPAEEEPPAEEQGIDPDELPEDLDDPYYQENFTQEQQQELMEAAIAQQARFGKGFGFDFMIGVRFP